MLIIYLWMFAAAGVSLLALLWFGSVDDDGLAPESDTGLAGLAAAFLSIRGMLAAMTLAGGVGAFLLGVAQLPKVVSVVGALIGAIVGAKLWRVLLRKLRYFDRDHGVSTDALLGREGTLTVGIASERAPGVVQVTLGGLSQEFTALPETDGILQEGSRVVIVRIESPSTVVVGPSPYPEHPSAK